MTPEQQDQIDARALRLHEAGHVIVALELGFLVRSASVQNGEGWTDVDTDSLMQECMDFKAAPPSQFTPYQLTKILLDLLAPALAVDMGGAAGEDSFSGSAMRTIRRSSDDFVSVFAKMYVAMGVVPVEQRAELLLGAFTRAQEHARSIVTRRKVDVEAVAKAFETSDELDLAAIKAAIEPAAR
jgi:hypothetical protein